MNIMLTYGDIVISPSLGVSVMYIIITAVLVKLTRSIFLQSVSSPYYQTLGLEFLATFEQLATVFELGVVMEKHGFPLFALLLIIMFNYWGKTWSSPPLVHPHIVDVIQNKTSYKIAFAKIIAQIAAASLVYGFYVKPIWSMGYRSTHLRRVAASRCFSHLKVPVHLGVGLEALATFVFLTCGKYLGTTSFSFITLPMVLVSLIYAGLTYTGCHINPIKALALQFGCDGFEWKDHLLVYWVGPIIGCLAFRILFLSGSSSVKTSIKIKKNK